MNKYLIITILLLLSINSGCTEKSHKFVKPKDDPLFMAIPKDDPEFLKAYKDARKSLNQFVSLISNTEHKKSVNAVKIKIYIKDLSEKLGEDRFAYLWVYNVEKESENYYAKIIELPKQGIGNLKIGDTVKFNEILIHDWMITRNGHLWGGYTIRVTRNKLPENQKEDYDRYIGINVYEPLTH